MPLSDEHKERFFEDGYIVVENLITEHDLEKLRRHYEYLVLGRVPEYPQRQVSMRDVEGRPDFGNAHKPGKEDTAKSHGKNHNRCGTHVYPKGGEEYENERLKPVENPIDAVIKMNVPSRFDDVFDSFVRGPRIVDIIEDLMGPNIKLYYNQVFAKPPYGPANRFHQDSVFWSFFASNFQITCQVLLDDSTVENGCVRFIPGSHQFGLVGWDHLPYILTEDVLAMEVPVPLKAGDATFHHSLTLHCSGPNTTPFRRRGWSIHYVSADTRYIGSPEETEYIKEFQDCLDGPEPMNGWPLIRGRSFPGCV